MTVITLGFGPGASISKVVLLGFSPTGSGPQPPVTPITGTFNMQVNITGTFTIEEGITGCYKRVSSITGSAGGN